MDEKYEYSNNNIENIIIVKDKKRRKIMDLLYESDDEGSSFKTISERCSIPPTGLVYHLNILRRAKLIERGFKEGKGREYTRYSLTDEGESMILYLKDLPGSIGSRSVSYPEVIMVIPMETGLTTLTLKEA